MIVQSILKSNAFNEGEHATFSGNEFQWFTTLTVKEFSLIIDLGAHLLNLHPLVK